MSAVTLRDDIKVFGKVERYGAEWGYNIPSLPHGYAWYVKALHQNSQEYYWWNGVCGGVRYEWK